MKKHIDQTWLEEKISQAADFGKVEFDSQKWKEKYILNKSDAATHSTIKPYKNFWRFIMKSKVTKYSAVGVVVLALMSILLSPFGTPGNGGVVLADVQRNMAEAETMIILGTKTLTYPGEPNNVFEFCGIKCQFDLVKYFSKQYGLVEEGYVGDELIYRFTLSRPKRQTLLILPPREKYGIFTSTDKQMQLLENLSPSGLINMFLAGFHRKLGRDNINGIEVEVFECKDTEPFIGLLPKFIADIQSLKGKVWIGIEEQLPVRVEGDLFIGKSLITAFNDLNLHEINTFGEYNVELDEEIFDITPPEGYTEITLTDILSLIPAEAKAGLVGLGLSSCIIPAGFIVWKRRRKKTRPNHH
jgi:hypothetical protein